MCHDRRVRSEHVLVFSAAPSLLFDAQHGSDIVCTFSTRFGFHIPCIPYFFHLRFANFPQYCSTRPRQGALPNGNYAIRQRQAPQPSSPLFIFPLCYAQRNRPDGKKKAYVRLTQDFDALEIANKIGII